MANEPQIRYFLGANSPAGFYSLYDELIDPARAAGIYILKGGPGCGKSTLMRQVAQAAEDKGLTVEYIPCSGDPASLDAVILPQVKTALVDGTAPHVVEPQYPGLVEKYVNLGDCYDKKAMGDLRQEIMGAMKGYKDCYQRAYRCLRAAREIEADLRALAQTPEVEAKLVKRAKGILSREIRKNGTGEGKITRRFLTAVTHQGVLREFGTVDAQCRRVYELSDSFGLGHIMLEKLLSGAAAAGWDVIACPSPTDPERLEHLLIPGLSLAFVTGTPAHPYPGRPYRRIRLDAAAASEALRANRARIRFSRRVCEALVQEAVEALSRAKAMHDDLEALYNPYVDFRRVRAMAAELVKEILSV